MGREVHARLDGDDLTGGERSIAGGGHPRALVDLEAHAVARGVQEGVTPAGGLDDLATGGVDRLDPTTSSIRCCAGSGEPTMIVRVMSEQ